MAGAIERLGQAHPRILEFGTYGVLIAAALGPMALAGSAILRLVQGIALAGGWLAGGTLGAGATGIGAGTAAGAAAGATVARAGLLRRILGPLGLAYLVKEGFDLTDPGGNLWGLTAPIDRQVERWTGWNPSGRQVTQLPGAPGALNADAQAFADRLAGIDRRLATGGPNPSPTP
jgi:hypothetical protein